MTAIPVIPANVLARMNDPLPTVPPEHVPVKPSERMIEPIRKKLVGVRRVIPADVPEIHTWLLPRLREKYPGASEIGILSTIRAAFSDRKSALIRSESCVGLYEARSSALDAAPVVWEVWLRSREGVGKCKDELRAVVASAHEWAVRIGVRRMKYGLDSDLPALDLFDAVPAGSNKKKTYNEILIESAAK